MKIYLLRHGESTSDIEDRYGGDYDDHLTEKGQSQAKELAEKISKRGIEIIFSSPRFRATKTAEILKDKLDCKLKIVEDLRERNRYGILTGMVKSEAKEKYPEQVKLLENRYNNAKGGEPYADFKKRAINTFSEITNSNFKVIAILSHSGPIRCITEEILRLNEIDRLGDCAIIEIQKENGELKVLNTDGVFFK